MDWQVSGDEMAQKSTDCLWDSLYNIFVCDYNAGFRIERKEAVIETGEEVEMNQEEGAEKPKIAITFDDGPHPTFTPQLLDGLKKRNVKASFFVIGNLAKANPEIIRRQKKEGHLIGNHTYHHVDITKMSDEQARDEIQSTNEVVEGIIGEEVSFVKLRRLVSGRRIWKKNFRSFRCYGLLTLLTGRRRMWMKS